MYVIMYLMLQKAYTRELFYSNDPLTGVDVLLYTELSFYM